MDTIITNSGQANSVAFFSLAMHPVKFRLFLLQKLPAAFFSGLAVKEVNEDRCTVTIPFKWFTQNPFRSTYFACLSMAAEMSTGILIMANTYKRRPSISILPVAMKSKFYKKATGLTAFTCNDGAAIKAAIDTAYQTLQPQTIEVTSSGFNNNGDLMAQFEFTWSFKVK